MRFSTSTAASLLALLQSTNASKGSTYQDWRLLAEAGPITDTMPVGPSSLSTRDISPAEKNTEWIDLPLDHFGTNAGTFRNRFWVNSKTYKPGGPVFIFDAGETDAAAWYEYILFKNNSYFWHFMNDFDGLGILWEHRFYGQSTPLIDRKVNITVDTPPEAFEFFTTEQALEDFVTFAKQFSRKDIDYKLTPDHTPWVWVGGSYPGMRGAWLREKHPEIIFASYSTSSPVQVTVDTSFFWDIIREGMITKGFGNCTRDIQAAIRHIDKVLDSGESAATALKEQFLGLGAGNSTSASFGEVLSLIYYQWTFNSVEGGKWGLRYFCDWLETDPETNKLAPEAGWAATKGDKWASDRWAAYPNLTAIVNDNWDLSCSGSLNKTGDCNLDLPFTSASSIAWGWQYCTEMGGLQPANLGPTQMVSKYNSFQHQKDICKRQFPTAPARLLPDLPKCDKIIEKLGGWTIRPSNVYWTNGDMDFRRQLSPGSDLPEAPKVEITQEIPKCGVSTGESKVFGKVLRNAVHGYDQTMGAYDNVPDIPVTQELFHQALREWLPCFHAKQ
ncbi:peptidase s28 [Curvularia clavata]|uniref:Peptidase s28 n=1 Tax=Curvularia clavata TaxID=95742 RepID=A0A9Q9DRM2_CURCL|nr:peptidase s28 [Curvularia clavata]